MVIVILVIVSPLLKKIIIEFGRDASESPWCTASEAPRPEAVKLPRVKGTIAHLSNDPGPP
jgi:hypothetical protein